jgi:PAS domain S-box-containing protein
MNQATRPPLSMALSLPAFWRRRSLQMRLLVLIILALLVAFVVVSVGIRRTVVALEEQMWAEHQQTVAHSAAAAIAHTLATMEDALVLVTTLAQSEDHTHPQITQRLLENSPGLLEIVYTDEHGRVLENAFRDAPLLRTRLESAEVRQQLAANPAGVVVVEKPIPSEGAPFLAMSTPDGQGGIVAARLDLAVLAGALQRLPLGDQGQAYLLDGQGAMLVHSERPVAELAGVSQSRPEFVHMTAAPNQVWHGPYTNFEQMQVIGASAPVGNAGWLVVTEIPRTAAARLSRTALWVLAGGLLLLGVMVVVAGGYFLRRLILLPLARLRTGVDRIGQGDLHFRIPVERASEFAQMALAFNRMAGTLAERDQSLRQMRDELESRVQARTAELAAADRELRAGLQERRAAEEALRRSEQAHRLAEDKYRTLVEQMPFITYMCDPDQFPRCTYISQQIGILGFSPEEWLADPTLLAQLIHPDDRVRVAARFDHMRKTGEAVDIEYRILDRRGRQHWFHEEAKFIYDKNGQRLYGHGVIFDITEQKATEAALRDSAQRIRLIADNLPALIAYVDHQQIYQFANRQFEAWYATGNIVGKHLRDIAGEQQYQGITGYVETALAGTPITFDYARTYPDGRQRFVEIAYIPHLGADDKVLGFFTLVQDLTERKEAEEQIKATLEEKVVLLKEIHHRVKNNLQVISSLLYLQSEQVADPQVRTVLQDSQNRVRSMALIHEKLYQAKDQVRVDMAEYIQNLSNYLFRSYTAHAGRIQLSVDVAAIQLAIDTAMPCGLIINELVSNALKHGFPDGRSGEIYIQLAQDDDGTYRLLVGDTGIGLPQTISPVKTSSLGLQLVHTLVRQLDGTVEFATEGGAQFHIRFADPH